MCAAARTDHGAMYTQCPVIPPGDLWVFGYGSLMWNPGFGYRRAAPALLRGKLALIGTSAVGLLDIRSQGYGEDSDRDGLTHNDVLEDENTAFVWTKWEPLELWPVDFPI